MGDQKIRKHIVVSLGSSAKSSAIKELAKASGLTVKRFSPQTTVLIATTVMDVRYRTAVSLGIPIVKKGFIQEIFERRTDPLFNIDSNLISDYILPRFEGLELFLAGFSERESQEKAVLIKAYGGNVCLDIKQATHIIVAEGVRIGAIASQQHLVTLSWLNESIDLGWCANEKSFTTSFLRPYLRRRGATKKGTCESARKRPSFRTFVERSRNKSDHCKYKRYQQSWELYKNEINTLKTIDLLLRVKSEQSHLALTESEIIFGNFELLHEVHTRIVEKLGKVLNLWDDNSVIGEIFLEESVFIENAYLPYLFGLESALEKLKECRSRNSKFKSFIENKEESRIFDKNKMDYLLSAPYQELTSRISVLLKEILKNTDAAMPDHFFLSKAVNRITELLQKANDFKKKNFENENIYKQIEQLPVCENYMRSASCVPVPMKRHSTTRKFRFLNSSPIHSVRHLQHITFSDQPPIYVCTIRSDFSDDEWVIQADNDIEETERFLETLTRQVESCFVDRQIITERIRYQNLENNRKVFLKRIISTGGFSNRSSSRLERSPLKKIRRYSQRLYYQSIPVRRSQTIPITSSEWSKVQTVAFDDVYRTNPPEGTRGQSGSGKDSREKSNDVANWKQETLMPKMISCDNNEKESELCLNDVVDLENERVDPYSVVKYFCPLRNLTRTSKL